MLVFQYGSNMSVARLNSPDRLNGDAKLVGTAYTTELYNLHFPVWSKGNNCAAASINRSSHGRKVYGVLYNIPDSLVSRGQAKLTGGKSLDAIEGEGSNYVRSTINVVRNDEMTVSATTYVAKRPGPDKKTSIDYANHILNGAKENSLPRDYINYLIAKIIESNPNLIDLLK